MRFNTRSLTTVTALSLVGVAACGSESSPSTPVAPPPAAQNQSPTAVIAPSSTSGSAPVGIAFDGNTSTDADGQVRSWAWNFGDGSSATGRTAEHVFQSVGTFTVTLTVTDDDGAQGTATQDITVTDVGADEIFGVVWFDENADGSQQAAEQGVPGIPLYLDANSNGALDAGETEVTTGIGGIYRFGGLSAGAHRVVQALPFGWANSFPGPGVVATPSPRQGLPLTGAAIIEGENAVAGEFPFQVSLQIAAVADPQNAHICGGTLIAPAWVLTASHCIAGVPAASLEVFVGSSSFASGGTRVPVRQLYVHPFYVDGSDSFKRDVGLIELETRIEDIPRAFVIGPDLFEELVVQGTLGTVIGWGRTGADVVNSIPIELQKVEIPVLRDTECSGRYGDVFDQTMICAGFLTGGKSSCQGDSGGPLLLPYRGQWYEAGVVSWGIGCALPNRPGVFARVAAMWDFLVATVPSEPSGAFSVTLEGAGVRADFGNTH